MRRVLRFLGTRPISSLVCIAVGAALLVPTVSAEEDVRRLIPGSGELGGSNLVPFTAKYQETIPTPDGGARHQIRIVHLQEAAFAEGAGLRLITTMMGDNWTVSDEVQLLEDSLRPKMRWVSALSLVHRLEVFADDVVRTVQMSKDGSSAESQEVAFDSPRFEASSLDLALARIAKRPGRELDFAIFSGDMGSQGATLTARARVLEMETLEIGGEEYLTHKIEIRLLDGEGKPLLGPGGSVFPTVTKWLTSVPPYTVRADWGPGHRVELMGPGS